MSINLEPRENASNDERRRAQEQQRVFREELPRVRAAAMSWRNGIAGLLAGLVGFSLIKGRSDISQLATPWRFVVGAVLLAALLVGVYGALRLLSAAHGRPRSVPRRTVQSRLAADHDEAARANKALDRGIAASLACAGLLVCAVAVTWYGPAADKPDLDVVIDGERVCGTVVRVDAGQLTLNTDAGERTLDLTRANGFKPVTACPST